MSTNPDDNPVAAVCGNQVRIYGPKNSSGKDAVRPLRDIIHFRNYGQARLYAQEFDDLRKGGSK